MSTHHFHVIVGLGITGLSCARFLRAQKIPFAMIDTRENPPNLASIRDSYPDVEIKVGALDETLLQKAHTIVLSPGIALHDPVIAKQIKQGKKIIGDIELFATTVNAPVIAITGTNAKSTVTTVVANMLQAANVSTEVGGNLGIPALDLLIQNPNADAYVLELSSFQLETTYSLKATVATVLNITPDHMDRYETFSDYQAAKHRIYHACHAAVCNRDDPLTECNTVHKKIYFTLNKPAENEFGLVKQNGKTFLAFGNQILISTQELPVKGKHYQANALASLAVGYSFGLPFEPMLQVLRTFQGLPHRCQFIRERNGIHWYNDSKGTNVGATLAAIEGLGAEINGKIVLIAGGVGKNADFHPLIPAISQYTRHVILLGAAANEMACALDKTVNITFAKDMQDAINKAANIAQHDDSVLLSPACASFDMFTNYAHRGEVFTDLVKKL